MKTLMDLESDSPEGFRNPITSNEEFSNTRQRSRAKAIIEFTPSSVQYPTEDHHDPEEE